MGEDPLDLHGFLSGFAAPEDGAVLLFLGTVRNHNDGRAVQGLEYEAYREMGEEVLLAIAGEAEKRFATDRLGVYHRIGNLDVGEVSTVIAVATPHREEAYGASRFIIEEIKKRLPVWKREKYVEGDSKWVQGHVPGSGDHGGAGNDTPDRKGAPGNAGDAGDMHGKGELGAHGVKRRSRSPDGGGER